MTEAGGPVVVAIDGPAGSGKSSVSRAVAERLAWSFLDTGAAYRAVAWFAIDRGIDTADRDRLLAVLDEFDYAISLDPAIRWVRVGGVEITDEIRTPTVTDAVSAVARTPEIRDRVTELFRRMIAAAPGPGIVVEGRDITTVVAPDAPVRILLTADPDIRAARRIAELSTEDADAVARALHRRDASDARVVDFLTAAPGVQVVDSTELDFSQTVDAVLTVIDARTPQEAADGR